MNTTQIRSRDDLLTDCERSMRYHQARARFYHFQHLFIQVLVLALAGASISRLTTTLLSEQWVLWLVAAIGVLALFSLVLNPASKAALHQFLYRSFTMLAGDISGTAEADEGKRAYWLKEIHALYAEEPPIYRALHVHCGNQIAFALDADPGYFVSLRWYHLLLRNLVPFQSTAFPNRNQEQTQDQAS